MARCHAWIHHDTRRRLPRGAVGIHGVGEDFRLPPFPRALPHAPVLLCQRLFSI